MKSRRPLSFVLSALVALAVAMPIAARTASAKDTKTTTATLDIFNAATLAGKEIAPGTYTFKIDGSTVTVLQKGKMVAEAPVQWKDAAMKANMTNIVTENNRIKEIHFGGKTKYVEVME
jgi:ribose/xylose/arabinose/galactoside ABC-type transport system permease subunit